MTETAAPALSPAVNQLAFYWSGLDDATKLIFNQLYREAPELVLRVLTQGQLQPNPAHTSLDQVVAPAGTDAVGTQPRVSVDEVKVTPQYPEPNQAFTVSWKRRVEGDIPNHSDAVQILKTDGTVVDERPVAQNAAPPGTTDEHSMQFDGLPLGEYSVNVWVNLEGSDGTGVPTAQGMRGQGNTALYVGNSEHAQAVQQMPQAQAAQRGIADAAYAAGELAALDLDMPADTLDEQFRQGLQHAAESLMQIESLAGGFQAELDRIANQLNYSINWSDERRDGKVSAVQQRLQGMQSINAAEDPGDLAVALLQVVGDLYE